MYKDGRYYGWIYKIYSEKTSKIYIGQTSVSLEMRWIQHKSDAQTGNSDCLIHRALRKYGIDNFHLKSIEEIISDTKENLLNKLNASEIYYIDKYNTLAPNGYNLTKGGNNCSERCKRSVNAYNAQGDVLMSFDSITEAMEKLNIPSATGICACCSGEAYSASGYIWRYKGDDFNKYPANITQEQLDKYNNLTPIDMYSKTGILIFRFDKIADALVYIGKTREFGTPITLCCKGEYNQAYGYVWRYKGDPFDKYIYKEPLDQSKVDVYYLFDGKFIQTFESINSALRYLNLPESVHGSCTLNCQGQIKSIYHKYVFRYFGDDFYKYGDPRVRNPRNQKRIYKYLLNGKWDSQIKSARAESLKNHYNSNAILNCCKGLRPNHSHEYGGFLWYYADDPTQPDPTKVIAS